LPAVREKYPGASLSLFGLSESGLRELDAYAH
jgi:hypothetical protein